MGDRLDGLVGEDSVMWGIARCWKAFDEAVREGEVAPLHEDDEELQQTKIAFRGNSSDGFGLEGHEVLGHRRPPALQFLDGPDGRLAASLQVVILCHHAGRVPQVVVQRRKDFQRGCRVGPLQGGGEVGVRLQPISDQRWNGGLVVVGSMLLPFRQPLPPPTSVGRRGWPQGSVPLHPTTLAPVQVTCKGFLVQQVLQHGPLKRLEPLGRVELAKGQNYILPAETRVTLTLGRHCLGSSP